MRPLIKLLGGLCLGLVYGLAGAQGADLRRREFGDVRSVETAKLGGCQGLDLRCRQCADLRGVKRRDAGEGQCSDL